MPQIDVIVVGGGPAGVAAALELRRSGIDKVVLLEREQQLGGATRHCSHSPFGMQEFGRVYFGASYGRRLEAEIAKAGIEVRRGHSVVRLGEGGSLLVTSDRGVETLEARRILVTTGARELSRAARLVTGDRPVGVLTTGALQSYVAFHGLAPFRRPLVVGSELVSLSALLTCRAHGIRPVAMIEPLAQPLAPRPLTLFPMLLGIPFHRGAELLDIVGRGRVEAAVIRNSDGATETLACDGVLFTGRFTPEAALFLPLPRGVDRGSAGPAVDQFGRTTDPICFAAGNVLRAVETGGWAFREGRAIGAALAADLSPDRDPGAPIPVTRDDPIKLVVPSLLRRGRLADAALADFQLRFVRRARGTLTLRLDGRVVFRRRGLWLPERRLLVPMPEAALFAGQVHFGFEEER